MGRSRSRSLVWSSIVWRNYWPCTHSGNIHCPTFFSTIKCLNIDRFLMRYRGCPCIIHCYSSGCFTLKCFNSPKPVHGSAFGLWVFCIPFFSVQVICVNFLFSPTRKWRKVSDFAHCVGSSYLASNHRTWCKCARNNCCPRRIFMVRSLSVFIRNR